MKNRIFIISALVALLSIGFISEADAQRRGHHPRGRAHGYYRHHHPRVWIAPPPPRPVVVVPPPPPHYYRHHHRPHRYPRYYSYHPRYYRR